MKAAARLADLWIGRHRADRLTLEQARARYANLRPIVVVTGGSRGIGAALGERFAAHGYAVALIARGAAEVEATAEAIASRTGQPVVALTLNLTAPDAAVSIAEALRLKGYYPDILINNAAAGLAGPWHEADPERIENLLALNIVALTGLTRAFLPAMLERAQGGILNVASLGGVVPGPGQAAYYASKAYVLSLTEALAVECAGRGVRICALAPGPVDTRFHTDMGAQDSPYRILMPSLSAPRTARAGYLGFQLGKRVIVPGAFNTLTYAALRILPHPISLPFVEVMLKKTRSGPSKKR